MTNKIDITVGKAQLCEFSFNNLMKFFQIMDNNNDSLVYFLPPSYKQNNLDFGKCDIKTNIEGLLNHFANIMGMTFMQNGVWLWKCDPLFNGPFMSHDGEAIRVLMRFAIDY